jgi:hypothetical protein
LGTATFLGSTNAVEKTAHDERFWAQEQEAG